MAKERSAAAVAVAVADAAVRRRYHHRLLRRAQRDNVLLPYEKPFSPELCPPASPSLRRLTHPEPPKTGLLRRIFRHKVPGSGIPQNLSSEQHRSNLPIRVKIKVRSPPKVMPAAEDDRDDEDATPDKADVTLKKAGISKKKRASFASKSAAMHVGREIEYPKKCNTKGNTTKCDTEGKILPTSRIGCTDLVDQPTLRLLEPAEFCFPRKRGRDEEHCMDAIRSKWRRHLEGCPESMIKKGYWTSEDLNFLKTNLDDDDDDKDYCEEGESSINDQAVISKKKSAGIASKSAAMEKRQVGYKSG